MTIALTLSADRKIKQGIQKQLPSERIIYSLDVNAVTSTPANQTVVVYHSTDDYITSTSANYINTLTIPTASSGVFTLPLIQNLIKGVTYKIHLTFSTPDTEYITAVITIHCN